MTEKNIQVSSESILEKYPNLDVFFKENIKAVFSGSSENIQVLDVKCIDMINDGKNNDLSKLDSCKDKTGVYIFIDEKDVVKYIGKGGTSKRSNKTSKDLRYRISQELRPYIKNKQNTLSRNIIEIDSILLNKTITPEDSIKIIKKFKIRILIAGGRNINNKANINLINKVENLELILISLLDSNYNR